MLGIRACLYEPFFVQHQATVEPLRVRNGTGHEEHGADIVSFDLSRLIVTPANAIEMITAFKRDDFRVRSHRDRGIVFNAPEH